MSTYATHKSSPEGKAQTRSRRIARALKHSVSALPTTAELRKVAR